MGVYLGVRVLHVLLAVFWAGAVFSTMLFFDPAMREAGTEGGKVMGILQRRGFSNAMMAAGGLTILSGLWLFWRMSGHFAPDYMGTPGGIMLSIGMLAGILILIVGMAVTRPTAKRLSELAGRVAAGGGQPSPEEAAELARLGARMGVVLKVIGVLMLVAVVTMTLGPHI